MVTKLSDIVWLLNPTHDSLKQLMDKLEDYAKRMATTKHTSVKFIIPDELESITLPVEKRRNIYLIFKEAIHNSMKYSLAREMKMEVIPNHESIFIRWQDSGIGFDPERIQQGNGLQNMHKRAEEIHASLQIESNLDEGTKTEIHVLL